MSRIRTIKPDAFRSETLSEVSLSAERTFFGLLTEADDQGRLKERPAVLNGALWSLRPEHTVRDMEDDLNQLERANEPLVCRYDIDGAKYLHLPTFLKHQKINRPTPSKLPPCPTCPESRGGAVPDSAFAAAEGTLFDEVEETHQATITPLPFAERRG